MDLNDFAFQDVLYDSLQSESNLSSTSGNSPNFDYMMKLSKHIEKFQDKEFREWYFLMLPRVVRASDKVEIVAGLDTYMCELLSTHKDSVTNLETVIKILNVVLKATTAKDNLMIPVPQKVLFELLELLINERNTRAVPGLFECLKLQIQNSKDAGLVTKIWEKVLQGISENKSQLQAAQILVDFSDYFQEIIPNFFKHKEVIRLIQKLLHEDSISEQKYGLHLLGIVIQILKRAEPLSLWELDYSRENNLFWNTYFELMKALIENRLEALQPLLETFTNNGFKGMAYENWMNVLFLKMLKSRKVSIKRLEVEWILELFKWVDLNADLQKSFIETLNNLHLYNYKEYILPQKNIGKFLNCDCKQLLESLAYKRWKLVPFHFWLNQLSIHKHKALDLHNLSKELLWKIATNVRAVEHTSIRRLTRIVFQELFEDILTSMSFGDECQLMETLYEIGDYYSEGEISVLLKKLSFVKNEEITTETFSKRFYEIIYLFYPDSLIYEDQLKLLLEVLKNTPKEKHSWLRFLLVFDTPANRVSEISEFCRLTYDLDLQAIAKLTLNEISNEFQTKLGCKENEMEFVHKKSLNFWANHRLEKNTDLEKLEMPIRGFLECGDHRTIIILSDMLSKSSQKVLPKDFEQFLNKIKTNLDMLKSYEYLSLVIGNVLEYCEENYPDQQSQYAENILNLDLSNLEIAESVWASGIDLNEGCLITGLLLGEPKKGEECLEEIYFDYVDGKSVSDSMCAREYYIQMLQVSEHITSIVARLLKLNKELSAKVNHHSNQGLSVEHRQQMRIACTISTLICDVNINKELFCSNDLWEILLEQKHRPSVRYLYELSTALNSPHMQRIMEQLKMALQYDENRQLSVISVAFCYCALRLRSIPLKEVDEVVNLLWKLTMNANPKSRLHAQMAIVLILEKCSEEEQELVHHADLLTTIKISIGNDFAELRENVRFIMPQIYETFKESESWMWGGVCDRIFYITNEPYDEYREPDVEIIKTLKKSRLLYAKNAKTIEAGEEHLISFDIENNEDKFKMQNYNSNCLQHLMSDTFVVASLVDNVEPIMQHCKDSGFENLILAPGAMAENPEIDCAALDPFGKSNLFEIETKDLEPFLSDKRDKGYKIIGAENTVDGIKLLQFKYSGKYVLVLGHEKNGIPANLFHLVDFYTPLSY